MSNHKNTLAEPRFFRLHLNPVTAAILVAFSTGYSAADEIVMAVPPLQTSLMAVEFNPDFLSGHGAKIDVSRFNNGNVALPGQYRAAVYVNQIWVGMTEVSLKEIEAGSKNVQPVFDRQLLERMGVDMTRLSEDARLKLDLAAVGRVAVLPDLIPDARAIFDNGEQRLDVSIPQAFMSRNARGWVDPEFWDDGVPAATLQYNANVYRNQGSNSDANTQGYLGLNAGLNAGPWRLRYSGNVTKSTNTSTHVQSVQTYVQRAIIPLKSQLTIGDSFTDGSVFDSFGLRGVTLGTDDRMYPQSEQGYAPVVHGIANSNAKVQIKQNGNIIYETTVAPGPFEISDLYATGYGGDLQVVVTEADGSQHISAVPYAAPVNAMRAGRTRYSVSAGQYRDASISASPFVFQGNAQHGFNNLLTGYGGVIVGEDYMSAAVGAGLNTAVGAFGLDVTESATSLQSQSKYGQSIRGSYSRLIAPTNTNLTLAAYRYSTHGYLNYADAMHMRDLEQRKANGDVGSMSGIQKGRLQLTLNQSLNQWGSLYVSGYTQNYWNRNGNDTQFQGGYNTSIGAIGLGFSAARTFDTDNGRWNNRYMATLSMPLGIGSRVPSSSTSVSHDTRDNSNQVQESINGTLGQDSQFGYGINASRTTANGNATSNLGANASYQTPYARLSASASRGNGYTQTSAGLSGSVVATQDAVALSGSSGNTFAMIEAKDAVGARVPSQPGARIDPFGHALVVGMSPYSMNNVEIDTKGLPMGVQLKTTEQRFAPTDGAVVKVKFETENKGQAVMLRVTRANGEALPFGADVFDVAGKSVGSVTQGGRVLVYGQPASQNNVLQVKWGEQQGQSCSLSYSMPKDGNGKPAPFYFVDGHCQ
ncbi:fimbria/pilus outer membrane usher protein [Silvimonas amylolytica]|uniref:Outer membrane usher protein n=1 Tax=Silvimonas amylolytica TaxID=449663 RepID=A0ABQ2PHJ6_9NEIS|nr:fimbria/pilus outer membrane usher protein [Silvimonas amylolytica]GGP25092.1 outer membrane usher protein [Silvimonas amylolytica]